MGSIDIPTADRFSIHRASVRHGSEIAFVREGIGGVPILMLHGWPSTKRIFYRNIAGLAKAGFEVIAPDIRGWGDSPANPAEGYADFVSSAHDFRALMHHLGHRRWVLAAFDMGSVSALHMASCFSDEIIRMVLWSAEVPHLPEIYAAEGMGPDKYPVNDEVALHLHRHGVITDEWAQSFPAPEDRRRYVMGFYQGRQWRDGGPLRCAAAEGAFDDASAAFLAETFEDPAVFRASLHYYAAVMNPAMLASDPPVLDRKIAVETLYLHGVEDDLIGFRNVDRAHLAFDNLVGPFMVRGAGHFLSWEQPAVFNSAVVTFCRDLL